MRQCIRKDGHDTDGVSLMLHVAMSHLARCASCLLLLRMCLLPYPGRVDQLLPFAAFIHGDGPGHMISIDELQNLPDIWSAGFCWWSRISFRGRGVDVEGFGIDNVNDML